MTVEGAVIFKLPDDQAAQFTLLFDTGNVFQIYILRLN